MKFATIFSLALASFAAANQLQSQGAALPLQGATIQAESQFQAAPIQSKVS